MVGTNEETATITEVSNGNESVKAMGEDLGPGVMPDTWNPNRVYLHEDPDGNKVPVPIGFTVSGVESERYVNHNVTKTGTLSNLTFSSSGDYAWTQNESDGIWASGNKGIASSESELVSNEITLTDGGYLSIECSVSSRASFSDDDPLSITITNTDAGTSETPYMLRGTNFGTAYNSLVYTKYNQELEAGKYIITIKYTKDRLDNAGLDTGYVKSGKILSYDENGADTITVHKAGGLVIYEGTDAVNDSNAWEASKNRNQFVWVPVSKTNLANMYEENSTTKKIKAKLWDFTATGRTARSNNNTDTKAEAGALSGQGYDGINYMSDPGYGSLPGYSKDTLYKELETDYMNTINSIEKYGGFYIGRYETGNITSDIPVVKRMNSTISNENWYKMYPRMRKISSNPNIQTSMIWGSLFDETLQWLIESGDKTRADIRLDSSNWGNYQNVGFTYNGGTKTVYTEVKTPTGSTERNKANNIYDLAGNVSDWTLEGNGSNSRYLHGSNYNCSGASDSAYIRYSYTPNRSYANSRFSRVLLHQMTLGTVDMSKPGKLSHRRALHVCGRGKNWGFSVTPNRNSQSKTKMRSRKRTILPGKMMRLI